MRLTENRAYEIDVSFRMKEVALDEFLTCDINLIDFNARDICPRISFRYRTMEGHTIGDNVTLDYAYPMASTVGPVKVVTWNIMYGKLTSVKSWLKQQVCSCLLNMAAPVVTFTLTILLFSLQRMIAVLTCLYTVLILK